MPTLLLILALLLPAASDCGECGPAPCEEHDRLQRQAMGRILRQWDDADREGRDALLTSMAGLPAAHGGVPSRRILDGYLRAAGAGDEVLRARAQELVGGWPDATALAQALKGACDDWLDGYRVDGRRLVRLAERARREGDGDLRTALARKQQHDEDPERLALLESRQHARDVVVSLTDLLLACAPETAREMLHRLAEETVGLDPITGVRLMLRLGEIGGREDFGLLVGALDVLDEPRKRLQWFLDLYRSLLDNEEMLERYGPDEGKPLEERRATCEEALQVLEVSRALLDGLQASLEEALVSLCQRTGLEPAAPAVADEDRRETWRRWMLANRLKGVPRARDD